MEAASEPSAPPKRKRASRAGQAKRFQCHYAACFKAYSRAEHLHRHELNHNPKHIYQCDEPACGQSFVRRDLFARHKARHEETSIESSELPHLPSLAERDQATSARDDNAMTSGLHGALLPDANVGPKDPSRQTNTSVTTQPFLTPNSSATQLESVIPAPSITSPQATVSSAAGDDEWLTTNADNQANDSFAAWLFDSPGSQNAGFDLANVPFLDFGLDYSPQDIWSFEVDQQPASDHHTCIAAPAGPPGFHKPGSSITDARRSEILTFVARYVRKQRIDTSAMEISNHLLFSTNGVNFPNLTLEILDNIIANYWLGSKQLNIIHQPTFCINSCQPLLLLAIVALGAVDLVRTRPRDALQDYHSLADVIITHLRWEIFTDADAHPPIQLWVAQSLLIVEYYEKHCSTRKLHERGHIHHSSTLTLLRRGSPLVGRSDSESPTSELPTRHGTPTTGRGSNEHVWDNIDAGWLQWVRSESFNRVVFAAFQMDILNAVMFGHAADMAPYEIRLALPCDDSLWGASSAEELHRLDANMKMYGIKPINFLDGLKRCLHGYDVQTHAPARILLMAGLLSVGWHISRREKHLQFLDTMPSIREQGRWRALLLQAFGHWRTSFDGAIGARPSCVNPLDMHAASPAILYHLAHMTMHADIIDCQILSGSKRLLGRKVSEKDYLNVMQRMQSWVSTPLARHATLHAFKLLHLTLLQPNILRTSQTSRLGTTSIKYNCRTDALFFRPWALFLAGLIMWAYQHASTISPVVPATDQRQIAGLDDEAICCRYLSVGSACEDPAHLVPILSNHGCSAVLAVLSRNFAHGEPEILQEASKRLKECRDMLSSNTTDLT